MPSLGRSHDVLPGHPLRRDLHSDLGLDVRDRSEGRDMNVCCGRSAVKVTPETIKAKYITPIDPMELAVRLAESYNGLKRPPEASTSTAFFSMTPDSQDAWMRAAHSAMEYWRECINNMQRPS